MIMNGLPYAKALTIRIPIYVVGTNDFSISADWAPAAGDVKVSQDGGSFSNIGTLPSYLGNYQWTLTLTAGEMTGSEIKVVIRDSATKAIDDKEITIYTESFGRTIFTVQASPTPTATQFDTDLTDAVDDLHDGSIVKFITGSLAGKMSQISGYDGTSTIGLITLVSTGDLALPQAPASGDKGIIVAL